MEFCVLYRTNDIIRLVIIQYLQNYTLLFGE